ncbi:hypothetical protein [Sulfuricurvum sp.]|uniref:hypothetical protein n=1 Tax=Sulfuricurvum sp. TaxID=2025608 RepID=UPI002612F9E1|nr:hypothetical protein [Sulfuricurvum sp.]MDD2782117.1 hypothetical protein [Sulfuricurvum sp.]
MDQEKVDAILALIAKRHSIIIDRDDPILAIMTANEAIFEDFLTTVERAVGRQTIEIEGITAKYIADAKELAEVKIGAAVTETYRVLDERHKLALKEIETATKTAVAGINSVNDQVKMNYLHIAAGSIALLLIGFFVGKIF